MVFSRRWRVFMLVSEVVWVSKLCCSWGSLLKTLPLPAHILRLLNKSSCIPQMLSELLFLCSISVGLLDFLFKGRDSVSDHPLALPDLRPLIFLSTWS